LSQRHPIFADKQQVRIEETMHKNLGMTFKELVLLTSVSGRRGVAFRLRQDGRLTATPLPIAA
jgi:hypothetical protein